jgi:DNA-binding protein H-NS
MQHLQAQLDELRAQEAAERSKEIQDYAEEIKDVCADAGWEVIELVGHLVPKRTRKAASSARKAPSVVYRDPDDPQNVYKGRGMPRWLREKMAERGYDPAKAAERSRFREEVLIAEAA